MALTADSQSRARTPAVYTSSGALSITRRRLPLQLERIASCAAHKWHISVKSPLISTMARGSLHSHKDVDDGYLLHSRQIEPLEGADLFPPQRRVAHSE
jgi:hypothetical protein